MTHEDIAAIVGRERTIGAVIEIASNMWVPGVTNRQNDVDESWFALGALDPDTQTRVESVAKLLRNSGRVEVMEDIRSAKWMKLVVNAAELIPSAILDLPLNGAQIIPIIGLPPVTANNPERYVDKTFDEVLKTFSKPDTLVTSLQDWRKGRRAEVQEVNGRVVDVLRAHGKASPMNELVVKLGFEIESGKRQPHVENSKEMIAAHKQLGSG
jgi:2-dehydropantoate 2-reductase